MAGGCGWPLVAGQVAGSTHSRPSTKTESGLFWAFVRPVAVVLVGAHGGGGIGGCWEEQVVAVAGLKMAREVGRIMHSSRGGGQCRLVGERVLSENSRALLALLRQYMG